MNVEKFYPQPLYCRTIVYFCVMAKNYFKSYIWLMETLQSHGKLTLKELKSLWMRSSVNDEHKELAPRTLNNHINSINDIFGIEIVCDRRNGYTYQIKNEEVIWSGDVRQWMLEALSLNSLLNESAGLKDRIIFENVPSSQKYLTMVIQAIRDGRVLETVYKSYRKPEQEELMLEPWCLREFKKRWYLFARKDGLNKPHMYSLDRFLKVEIGTGKFKIPKNFNAHDFFSGYYGIRTYADLKPQRVRLKANGMQAKFFRSLPLHSSQEEVEAGEDYAVFQYYLTPDYDFKQDVLSFGTRVEILEPTELREEFSKMVSKLKEIYEKDV